MSIFNLEAILSLNSKQYEDGLNDAEGKANSFGTKLASGLGTAAKIGAAAVGASATAVGALAKQSVDAYSEFEQLAGGVETLFGDSANKVLKNADNAFKTAGMSANQYMETSIQSAAALINSLGNDQAAAADLMNVSITDMSDNVNKMGTTMEAVQNAYRGFSRGNFTMLDNLALGFSGTKEGMQELLDKAQEISGVKFDISSYADIIKAIHVVQQEMGISGISAEEAAEAVRTGAMTEEEAFAAMGTTAKEAAGTIAGSAGSIKAAWDNLVTGIARPDADLGQLIGDVVASAETALNNFLPAFEQALNGIATFVEKAAPIIARRLPKFIKNILPSILNAGASLLNSIVKVLPQTIQQLITQIVNLFTKYAPQLVKAGVEAIVQLAKGLSKSLPKIIPAVIDAVLLIVDTLVDNIPLLVDAALQLIVGLAKGLIKALPRIIQKIPEIIEGIVDALLDSIDLIIDAGVELFVALVENLPAIIDGIIKALPKIILAILEGLAELGTKLAELFTKAWEGIKEIFAPVGEFFGGVWNAITGAFATVGEWFSNTFGGAWEGIKNVFSGIGEWFQARWNDIVNVFINVGAWFAKVFVSAYEGVTKAFSSVGEFFASVWNTIKGMFSGVWDFFVKIGGQIIEGLKAGVTGAWNGFVEFFANVMGGIQGIAIRQLKIGSPSKVFAEIGKFIDLGLAEGIDDNISTVNDAVEDLLDATMDDGFYQDREIVTTTSVESRDDGTGSMFSVPRYAAPQYLNLTVELGGQKVQSVIYQMVQDEAGRVGMQIVRGNA